MSKEITAMVVGFKYRGQTPQCLNRGVITLRREPENRFDTHAIMVLVDNDHVGYITKEDAKNVNTALVKSIKCIETYPASAKIKIYYYGSSPFDREQVKTKGHGSISDTLIKKNYPLYDRNPLTESKNDEVIKSNKIRKMPTGTYTTEVRVPIGPNPFFTGEIRAPIKITFSEKDAIDM
jgi:hypothetical protein